MSSTKAWQACESQDRSPFEIALADFDAGKVQESLERLERCVRENPKSHLSFYWLGTLRSRLGNHAEAAALFRRAISLDQENLESVKGLVIALVELQRFAEAEQPARTLLRQAPEDATSHVLLSSICAATNRPQEAIAAAEEALRLGPTDVAALLQLARALILLDRDEDAIAVLSRAKGIDPDNLVTNLRLAQALKFAGHFDRAREQLKAILRVYPSRGDVHYELSEIEAFEQGDEYISEIEAELSRCTAPSDARWLHFALGKAYDDCGQSDKAFPHFVAANALERAAFPYNEANAIDRINRTIEIFSAGFLQRLRGSGVDSPAPIFIVGMPRSGTTLVEQILASHSEVSAGGEVDVVAPALRNVVARSQTPNLAFDLSQITIADVTALGLEYISRIQTLLNGRRHLTDKQLTNRLFVGLIHAALPNAKIIHCQRNALDSCLSAFMKPFGASVAYASDLGSLGRYYRHYELMMAHWRGVLPPGRMLEVRYEDIVDDVEGEARRILAYCGLEWQPKCLEFYRARRPIRTASVAQVRQPIYRTSLGRSRPYLAHLQPLIAALQIAN